jgi:predicted DNA-binding protein with PD1-like motif
MRTNVYQLMLASLLLTSLLCGAPNARSQAPPTAAPASPAKQSAEAGAVPAVHTVGGHFTRVVVVRLKNNADMLDGLKTAVAREKIKNAVILSGAGSLVSYHVHVVSNTTFPPTNAFTQGAGPYDLLTTTGYVINGRVHAHITFSDTQKTLGGHLEMGTRVFTFAVIALGVLDEGASLERFDDYNWR